MAVNLKACNAFRLSDGKAAEAALRSLQDAGAGRALSEQPLLRHNVCVFRSGEGALQSPAERVASALHARTKRPALCLTPAKMYHAAALAPRAAVLPSLSGVLPEARLNQVIFHLRRGDVGEAYALVRDAAPATPQECGVGTARGEAGLDLAVVYAVLGQREGSADLLKQAQQDFQAVGASPAECDTIPGRQAMASCFFLLRQFDDVLVFLESVRSYFPDDDDFNWNYGIALAAAGRHAEAEAALAAVTSEAYRREDAYVSWLAKALIATGRAPAAWELYAAHEASGAAEDRGALLRLIANDAYKMGQFAVALRAFDALERLDPDPQHWEAKMGSAAGVLQAVIAGKEHPEALSDAAAVLAAGPASGAPAGPAAGVMLRVIRGWAADNGIELDV
ncbi:Tetratricopeptide repeat protein 26 [Monoraphidium neglectum]|uniref:Tetratricopeptide repeat protein 26 n=1 Tax=Monoraphidium neglectum TaxID=145388 RepID=A0A0D2JUD3_9CHLO|nr:Tetratricopeptide repeat protein 26 [Monoraphidium neglectum]KIZ02488.1 Tetratricopeptide repeat protein 26 [Monoraphidium neglectum]|eukprot:XP_013901507.1 Tetratricopeptide repeat protein 26 [Monoraphidium neglectum]